MTKTPSPTRAYTVHIAEAGQPPRLIGVYLDELLACEALDAAAEALDVAGMPMWENVAYGMRADDLAAEATTVAYWGGDPARLVEASAWVLDADQAVAWIEEHLV